MAAPSDYKRHADVLRTADTSTTGKRKEMVDSLKFFHTELAVDVLPPHFDLNMIDVFLALAHNHENKGDIRAAAMRAIVILLDMKKGPAEDCSALRHSIIDKGVLQVAAAGVDACYNDSSKLRVACVDAIRAVTCDQELALNCQVICVNAVVQSGALQAIVSRIVSLEPRLLRAAQNTVGDICVVIMNDTVHGPAAAGIIMGTLASALRSDDLEIMKHAFKFLKPIPCYIASFARFSQEIIQLTLNCIAANTDDDWIVCPAFDFLSFLTANALRRDMQFVEEQIFGQACFMIAMDGALRTNSTEIQKGALDILNRLVIASTQFTGILIQSHHTVERLKQLLLSGEVENEVWLVVQGALQSLNDVPRPALQSNLLGTGILRAFLTVARDSGDAHKNATVAAILGPLLAARPEFGRYVEAAGYGQHVPGRGAGRTAGSCGYIFVEEADEDEE